MRLRVDTSALTLLVVAAAAPVRDFESGRAKIEDGQPLFSVRIVVMDRGRAMPRSSTSKSPASRRG